MICCHTLVPKGGLHITDASASRAACTVGQRSRPSRATTRFWALRQTGSAACRRTFPFSVTRNGRHRRRVSGPISINPRRSRMRKLRVRVVRSIARASASSVIEEGAPRSIAASSVNCVTLSPRGRRASSKIRLTLREAIRARKAAHSRSTSVVETVMFTFLAHSVYAIQWDVKHISLRPRRRAATEQP